MNDPASRRTGVANPEEAWRALSEGHGALLVDVRSRAEWTFVGAPDLAGLGADAVFIEWRSFPTMAPNPGFLDALEAEVERAGARDLYFICRSGARSHDAAVAAAEHFAARGRAVSCTNVVEGFEGDLDAEGRRGRANGWKARGLPWRQS